MRTQKKHMPKQACPVYLHPAAASCTATIRKVELATGAKIIARQGKAMLSFNATPFGGGAA